MSDEIDKAVKIIMDFRLKYSIRNVLRYVLCCGEMQCRKDILCNSS